MNIIRNIRLSKLGIYQIKESEKDFFDFIQKNLFGLKPVKSDVYSNYIMYFNRKGENIFQHSLNSNYLYISYNLIWQQFEKKFKYNYQEIIDLIKYVVEKIYKLKDVIIKRGTIFS